ncbi:MAG: hypothetical protein ACAH95_00430 [Fimbriimonas sp.]
MNTFFELIKPVWDPHAGQLEFLLNNARLKVLACGRRWGKTDACAAQVVSTFVEKKPTKHFLVAPTIDQAKLLFNRILDLIDKICDLPNTPFPDRPKFKLSPFP